MPLKLTVEGMHCNSCKMLIEDELEDMGARDIEIAFDADTQRGTIIFDGIDAREAMRVIEDLGEYKVKG